MIVTPRILLPAIRGFLILSCLGCLISVAQQGQIPTRAVPGTHAIQALEVPPGNAGFTEMDPVQSGIRFTNRLGDTTLSRNSSLMSGSGVALGDVDGDGRCDLYFCNLEGRNALFKNLGQWKFADITESSGVGLQGALCRGAVLADADGDSDLDLFVSFNAQGVRLFLNDGRGHFTETTQAAGLASRFGSTTMALADIDGNGSLDLYLANFGEISVLRDGGPIRYRMVNGQQVVVGRFANRLKWVNGQLLEFGEPDVLYLNDGQGRFIPAPWGSPRFLKSDGSPMEAPWDFGLCVQMRDLNGDGAPDIYVCNDFQTPDRVWINDTRGSFKALDALAMRRFPYASMGMDAADIDRDGRLDLFVVEMLATDPARRLRQLQGKEGATPSGAGHAEPLQVARNTMFWNRKDGTWAEIARHAGLEASDWSWMPVFLDVDLDGYEDLLVTNGQTHDVNDRDMLEQSRTQPAGVLAYPKLLTPNAAFKNNRDLTFQPAGAAWKFQSTKLSHGIALADLDNDGDLDVVVNCLNDAPLLYRNDSPAPRLHVRLKGLSPNTGGIGAKITVRAPGLPDQSQEILSGGRYLSSDDPARVFAAGHATNRLQVEIAWRSGKTSVIPGVPANSALEVREPAATSTLSSSPTVVPLAKRAALFEDRRSGIAHRHQSTGTGELAPQPLDPHPEGGVGLAAGFADLDGDGRERIFIGEAIAGSISGFRQGANNAFTRFPLIEGTNALNAGISAMLAVPGRGKPAWLVAVSGGKGNESPGSELWWFPSGGSPKVIHRSSAAQCRLACADFDGDGLLDLFCGAGVVRGRYPESTESALIFGDASVTESWTPGRALRLSVGSVQGVLFSDLDSDGRSELVVASEWSSLRAFSWNSGKIAERTRDFGLESITGMWQCVAAGDFDGDGRIDLVAGNWGDNSEWRASVNHPMRLAYYADGSTLRGAFGIPSNTSETRYPLLPLDEQSRFLPWIRETFPTHASYAAAGFENIVAAFPTPATLMEANTVTTTLFLNRGPRFEARPLPAMAQWSPVRGMAAADFNGDGFVDLALAQNQFSHRNGSDRDDAGRGLLLLGDGKGGFRPLSSAESGLAIDGEQRSIAAADFDRDGRMDLLVTQQGEETVFLGNTGATPSLSVRLHDGAANPRGIGASVRWVRENERGPRHEIRAGNGGLGQDGTAVLMALPAGGCDLEVTWPGGEKRMVKVPSGRQELDLAR